MFQVGARPEEPLRNRAGNAAASTCAIPDLAALIDP